MTRVDGEPRLTHGGLSLAAVMVLAVGLRLAWLDAHSFWLDETNPMRLARTSGPAELIRRLPEVDKTGAPLHPLLLQAWVTLFGPSDLAARLMGAVTGSLTVLCVFWVASLAYGGRVATWAALVCAVSPMEVYYSQEVRMYSLLGLITCICWGLLLSFRTAAPVWKGACLALGQVALIYTHPLGGLMAVALAVGYLVDRESSRQTLRSWAAIETTVALGVLPWLGRYLDHPPDPKSTGWTQIADYVTWPRMFLGAGTVSVLVVYAVVAWGMLRKPSVASEGLFPMLASVRNALRRFEVDRPKTLSLLLVWMLVPFLLLLGYSKVRSPIFGPMRYLLFLAPPVFILLAKGMAELPRSPRVAMALFLAVQSAAGLWTKVYAPGVKPDWRRAAALIRDVDPNAVIVVECRTPHFYPTTMRYYLADGADVATWGDWSASLQSGLRTASENAWFIRDEMDAISESGKGSPASYRTVQAWKLDRLRVTYRTLESGPATQTAVYDAGDAVRR